MVTTKPKTITKPITKKKKEEISKETKSVSKKKKEKIEEPVKKDNVEITDTVEIQDSFVVSISPSSQVESPIVELIPEFKEAEENRMKEESQAEQKQNLIKKLRKKLEDGTISDGEAAELYNLLLP
jgi:hypothetical protein